MKFAAALVAVVMLVILSHGEAQNVGEVSIFVLLFLFHYS